MRFRPVVRRTARLAVMVMVASLAAAGSLACADGLGDGLVDELKRTMQKHDVPAMGAVCLRGDEIQEWAVAGLRRRGGSRVALPEHLWHLGSCTKAMTATLAARLVERGVMRWDMTIVEVFPEIRDRARPEYLDVTFERLLTNRGGIPRDVTTTKAWRNAWAQRGSLVEQRHQFMLDVLELPPPVAVGEYLYSNQGFVIAGHMMERRTDLSWEDLVTREVFEPLGMTTAGFGAPAANDPEQPVGHTQDGKRASPKADNPPVLSPAGRVHCRLDDWARFVAIHLLGAQGEGGDYLERETFEHLHRPASGPGDRYAMGWQIRDRRWGGTVLTHAGSNTMWYCVAWIAPEKNFAVLVTCNQGGPAAVSATDEMCGTLIKRELARQDAATPDEPKKSPPRADER